MAATHTNIRRVQGKSLPILEHLNELKLRLKQAHTHFTQAAEEDVITSYAGEWFLDNFYIVQQAVNQIAEDMPSSYYKQLPKLASGSLENIPRVYALAHAFGRYTQVRVLPEEQCTFIEAYQRHTILTTAELWAWPAMLRAMVIENLTIALDHFVEDRLYPSQIFLLPTVQSEYSSEIDAGTLIANCIMSLRAINVENWQKFFEEVSYVEAILKRDPSNVYAHMDFATRNRYRRKIELLAQHSDASEEGISQAALQLAQQSISNEPSSNHNGSFLQEYTAHVGYYLIDDGLYALEKSIGYHATVLTKVRRHVKQSAFALYLGSILFFTFAIVLAATHYTTITDGTAVQIAVVLMLMLTPATTVAIHFINWLAIQFVSPYALPKLDFSDGIPPSYQTMVVIPALLTDFNEIDSLAKQLEQHYLRNTDQHVYFAILGDFADADTEHMPQDDALLQHAKARIEALNARYQSQQHKPFFLFLRRRQWNASEGVWMGYERKRGKLAEINRLLLDPHAETSYFVKLGDLSVLTKITYVITLDADTILPRDTVQKLVGTIAHPLNKARFSSDGQKVERGYSILQPRIEILLTTTKQTPFTRIFAGDKGLDLYTLAVSDVYQDLFGEGIYVGKGIYDVAAFEKSLKGHVPENALLSHDLFEGLHGRAALVTDIVLLEDYPGHYLAYTNRLHRWVRGDWQLLPWLFPSVPAAKGGFTRNRFSPLDIWKIVDNLRRSLLQPTLLTLILLSWFWLPGSPFVWTILAIFVLILPFLSSVANQFDRALEAGLWSISQRVHLSKILMRYGLSLAFLPYEAFLRVDAIASALIRLWRQKHLLQWTTAANATRRFQSESITAIWQHMRGASILVVAVAIIAFLVDPQSLLISVPLVLIWLSSPILAEWISRPRVERPHKVLDDRLLRTLARRTWLYFEEFVGPRDHWLPPDHYQQSPISKIGRYTSPTNIGLMLLSTLAAYDMGYIGLLELMVRFRFTFESIRRLEHYRGHLLNWHSTQTLQPLHPRYVSTVDSGNYAGGLLVLKQGCKDLLNIPVLRWQRWRAVLDILDVLNEILSEITRRYPTTRVDDIRRWLKEMRYQVSALKDRSENWSADLKQLTEYHWRRLSEAILVFVEGAVEIDVALLKDLRIFLTRLHAHFRSIQRDMELLLPWFILLDQAPNSLHNGGGEVSRAWQSLLSSISPLPCFGEIHRVYEQVEERLGTLQEALNVNPIAEEAQAWCQHLREALNAAKSATTDLRADFKWLQQEIELELGAMDFGFLYNHERHLFHIGYNVDMEQLDSSYYDLLASEARLTSFLAIAKRDIPLKHWLQLNRPITQVNSLQTLLSWGGTMFEYLMPLLIMEDYSGTLLHQSYEAVVSHQIHYAKQNNIPWGMSESGYYAFDSNQNYQYRAFGVPSLALRRGQEGDLVVAPYASLMALPIMPEMVIENIRALIASGALNTYGFVEALDYTPSRLPLGQEYAIVKEHMAHHQGMIFISLTNFLNEGLMVRRFHSDPRVESVALLLMEQIPDELTFEEKIEQEVERNLPSRLLSLNPWEVPIVTPSPQVHYLSNGRYAVLITNAGSGYSIWKKQAVTRWRADSTLDDWGTWIYIRDENSGVVWSPTCQPMGSNLDKMRAIFYPHKAEFVLQNMDISSRLEILVPPDDDLEIRRLRLTNHTEDTRHLLISSYGEMALAPQRVDQRHPAFNKMFIESEYLPELQALLFRRRLRSSEEEALYVIHMLVLHDINPDVQYETNRAHFIGRNRTYRNPVVLQNDTKFSGTTGTTLDPIMAIAERLEIPPHSTVEVAYITLASDSREGALSLARQYQHSARIDRAFDQARFSSERELRRLALDTDTISHFQKLLSSLPYPHAMFRTTPAILATNSKPQSSLWSYGISGDYPIMLVQIKDQQELELIGELVHAHRFWRNRGFDSTLVILNQRDTGYTQELHHQIHRLIVRMGSETWINRHDGIFILRAEQMNEADQILLQTAARLCLKGEDGNLESQLVTRQWHEVTLPQFLPTTDTTEIVDTPPPVLRPDNLLFDNGFGGFTPDGREYLIYLVHETNTPAPWTNVIANPNAGFIISEVGGGFSWAQNSSENRLSVWRNDPVTDMPSEVIYLRDEETAAVWSPTPMPAGTEMPFLIRHGWGYSTIEHQSHGLHQTVYYYMAPEFPMKFVRLKLKNTATRPRRITITYYIEWVLGPYRDMTQQYLIPEFDADRQILMAHNPYSIEFGEAYTFITASQAFHGLTTDRAEFLGRLGSYAEPAALKRIGLSNTVHAGTDPCGVVQLHVDLPISGEEEVCFILGGASNKEIALQLAENYRSRETIQKAWVESLENWRHILDSVVVRTPDTGMNLLLPWLLYQALSCRIWGRSGLYQSSGAYGFRDQLQDVMALIHIRPDLTREHILRAARHQFEAGDVLHWWHPPSARGVRTRFSDDLVWLPFVVAHYVQTTGDESILHAREPFLKGEPLQPDEVERYGFYETTMETYTIYEHCRRALQQADTSGRHNLPLMQAGDWNDGMNRVGIKGHGESIWMGWFLYYVFDHFRPICMMMNDAPQAEIYRRRMEELKAALENAGWDGEWYRRGYYDDGTPLGYKQSMECQIDSIAQSWAVLSGAAESTRAQQAISSVEERLIRKEDRLILLFTPPFNRTAQDPGYIKGYPPGIRENGGQYTHAALWVVWAYTEMNKATQAEALFRFLNPIYHSDSLNKAKRYAVEPYVIAADVYSEPPHTGHGGWTWYTGSSGWMYRLGIEAILGLYRQGTKLRIEPRIPAEWSSYEIDYRYKKTTYRIKVLNPNHVEYGVREIRWNRELLSSNAVSLVDDGKFHEVSVVLG